MTKKKKSKLPQYCNGCLRRMDLTRCSGWVKASGCGGRYYTDDPKVIRRQLEEMHAYLMRGEMPLRKVGVE